MCQVHTCAYVSLLTSGETHSTACHPRKTTTYIITRSIYHQAYARQTQVNWRKETKKITKDKGKERKEKDKKSKKRQDKKRKQGRKGKEEKNKRKMSYYKKRS